MRIQKLLSEAGVLSRRKAEEYVRDGRVTVNGRPAVTGQDVNPKRDAVAVDGKQVDTAGRRSLLYVMLHKPRGYVTTLSDDLGRRCVAELIAGLPGRVYPVGRLDRDSEGLLIFTNDGEFANLMMHPRNHVGKTYRVTVHPAMTDEQAARLAAGVEMEAGDKTAPAQLSVITEEPGRTVFRLTIYEGKNRQIRRMCEAVGLEVARLRRVAVGPVKLGMLPPGKWREMTPEEVRSLRRAAQARAAVGQASAEADGPEGEGRPGPARSQTGPRTAGQGGSAGKKIGRPGAGRGAGGPRKPFR
jgi:23S rRNA pseudouridine2605 synthase